MTNGGVSWRDLRAVERDTLVEVARVSRSHDVASGAEIHRSLQEHGYDDLTLQRCYALLEKLEDLGLAEKTEGEGINDWEPTGTGGSVMQWHAEAVASQIGMELRHPGGIVNAGGRA